MTPQEAIEALKDCRSNTKVNIYNYETQRWEYDYMDSWYAINMAIEALQKQIPIPPEEKVRPEYAGLGKNYYCRCGVMFNEWMSEYRRTNYCGNCGQRLLERGDAD